MILLKKITLKDFLSHKETEIVFGPNDQMLLDGASGAGKSSIFDAIIWALYGVGRVDNRSLVRRGAKKSTVKLELVRQEEGVINQTVVITRTTTPGGKHALELSTEQLDGSFIAHPLTGIRELQNFIDKDLIGASYLLFINSVAYVQGSSESFVAQTAPKRKELLLEIVKAEDYGKYYEKARTVLSTLASDEQKANGQVIELEAQLGAIKSRLGGRDSLLAEFTAHTARLMLVEPNIKVLEAENAKYAAVSTTIDALDGVFRSCQDMAVRFEKELKIKVGKVAGKDALAKILEGRPSLVGAIDELKKKLHSLRINIATIGEQEAVRNAVLGRKPVVNDRHFSEIEYINKKIQRILEQPVCPSGVACPYSGDHTKEIEDLKNSIKEHEAAASKQALDLANWSIEASNLPPAADMRALMSDVSSLESEIQAKENGLVQLDIAQRDLAALAEIESQLPGLTKEMQEKWTAVDDAKKTKDEAEKSSNKLEASRVASELLSLRAEEKLLNEKLTRTTAALEGLDLDESEAKKIESKIKDTRDTVISAIQDKARKVALAKDAFAEKGIKTLVVDYILPKLEDKINVVLAQLSDFRIHLDTQKKTADGEGSIEGLHITVINECGEEMPYEAYSGGEKVRITFAIAEALASLGKNKVGFRLIDEAVLALDPNSLESFMETVEGLLSDFGQVLFISHIQEVKDMFDKQLIISKTNGISYVK